AGVRPRRRQTDSTVCLVVQHLLVDFQTDAAIAQADFVDKVRRDLGLAEHDVLRTARNVVAVTWDGGGRAGRPEGFQKVAITETVMKRDFGLGADVMIQTDVEMVIVVPLDRRAYKILARRRPVGKRIERGDRRGNRVDAVLGDETSRKRCAGKQVNGRGSASGKIAGSFQRRGNVGGLGNALTYAPAFVIQKEKGAIFPHWGA